MFIKNAGFSCWKKDNLEELEEDFIKEGFLEPVYSDKHFENGLVTDFVLAHGGIYSTFEEFADVGSEFPEEVTEEVKKESFRDWSDDSLRRSRRILKDLLLANECDNMLFVTFTNKYSSLEYSDLNIEEVNEEFKKQILKKCQNYVQRVQFSYILVPELTKRGYLHFHGIIWDFPVSWLRDSGKRDKHGRTIFNLIPFDKNGFTTATLCSDVSKSFTYISKYITKDLKVVPHLRRFYHSRNILTPTKYMDFFFEPDSEPVYENEVFKIYYIN